MTKYALRPGSRGRALVVGLLVGFIVLLAGSALAARHVYLENLKPLSASEKSQVIPVATGSTARQIGDQLETAGIIRKSWAFQWYVRNSDLRDKLQAGTYALKPSQSVQEIAQLLTQGKIDTQLVTILPGKRIDEIRDKLINDGFDAAEVDAALDPALYSGHPALVDKPAEANLEGYLYPESFQRTAATKPETIIAASLDQMQRYLTPELRAGLVAQGLTVHQGVILASIVEREVSDVHPEDRPKVAQVFLKRLSIDMKLQSDATASYGAVLDGREPRSGYDSPYNTYLHAGLTPTPISNVSRSSLEAVANPAATDYLFFVSGDDNINYFSRTQAEHEANVAKHCFKKCGR